jgi:hypothetical protein
MICNVNNNNFAVIEKTSRFSLWKLLATIKKRRMTRGNSLLTDEELVVATTILYLSSFGHKLPQVLKKA